MKVIKKTKEYTVYQKGSGRYAVKDADKNWVNADAKITILLAEGLIKTAKPAPPVVQEVVEETAVEETPVVEEAPVEEPAPAEEAPAEEAAPVVEEAPAVVEEAPAKKLRGKKFLW